MAMSCRKAFSDTILELGRADGDIVVLASDSRGSALLSEYVEALPGQFVEVGIAEQNSIGMAAGMALCGLKPFVCAPASFLSARSFEQIKVDLAYAGADVKVIAISGGVSYGALGLSHHSLQDIAMMRATPGIAVILPCDAAQTRAMTRGLAGYAGPVYVRMGRGAVEDVYEGDDAPFTIGRANTVHEGRDVTIIGCGETVRVALDGALLLEREGVRARVLDMHTLKPLDEASVLAAARETGRIVTVEEHSVHGGLGAAVAEVVVQRAPVPMRILGIADEPTAAGSSAEIFAHYGLTASRVAQSARELIQIG